jgi:hypothetical protein
LWNISDFNTIDICIQEPKTANSGELKLEESCIHSPSPSTRENNFSSLWFAGFEETVNILGIGIQMEVVVM